MNVVLDTNVWISAWLWRGSPNNFIRLARNKQIIIGTSEALLAELENTLGYKKLQRKIQSLNLTKEQLLTGTREITEMHVIGDLNVPELRDPDDNMVLATAIAAQAEVIITGDRDLLVLAEYENIQIVNTQDFLQRYFDS